MSDLSPQSAAKRTSANAYEFMDSCPAKGAMPPWNRAASPAKGSGPLLCLGLVFVVFSFVLLWWTDQLFHQHHRRLRLRHRELQRRARRGCRHLLLARTADNWRHLLDREPMPAHTLQRSGAGQLGAARQRSARPRRSAQPAPSQTRLTAGASTLEPVLGRRRDRVERRPTPQKEQAAPSGAARASGTGMFFGTATSAAPFEGAGLDRVREGPDFGAGAAVFAL